MKSLVLWLFYIPIDFLKFTSWQTRNFKGNTNREKLRATKNIFVWGLRLIGKSGIKLKSIGQEHESGEDMEHKSEVV